MAQFHYLENVGNAAPSLLNRSAEGWNGLETQNRRIGREFKGCPIKTLFYV